MEPLCLCGILGALSLCRLPEPGENSEKEAGSIRPASPTHSLDGEPEVAAVNTKDEGIKYWESLKFLYDFPGKGRIEIYS